MRHRGSVRHGRMRPGKSRIHVAQERTGEDAYQISLALAAFNPDEITIIAEQNVLTVQGRKAEKGDHAYIYQGISSRPFKRVFNTGRLRPGEERCF